MVLTTALIGAGIAAAGATAGAAGSAANRKKAREEEARNYQNAKDYLNSMYYRDPLNTMSSRWLLKAWNQDKKDELDALNNRVVAGGATMENQLAGLKAINKRTDNLYGQILQGEDSRRDRISGQLLSLEDRHSGAVQGNYMQAAQDWNQWGGQVAQAGLSLMNSGLLGGAGASGVGMTNAQGAEAMGVAAKGLVNADMMQPIGSPSLTELPGAGLGGLRGPGVDLSKSALTAGARFPWTPD